MQKADQNAVSTQIDAVISTRVLWRSAGVTALLIGATLGLISLDQLSGKALWGHLGAITFLLSLVGLAAITVLGVQRWLEGNPVSKPK